MERRRYLNPASRKSPEMIFTMEYVSRTVSPPSGGSIVAYSWQRFDQSNDLLEEASEIGNTVSFAYERYKASMWLAGPRGKTHTGKGK